MRQAAAAPKMAPTPRPGWGVNGFGSALLAGLSRILGRFAAAVLFLVMAMTFCDVMGRYLFNAPLPGTYEITQVGLGMLIFAALPLVTERAEHVAIDLVDTVLPPVWRRPLNAAIGFAGAVVMFGVAAAVWLQGIKVAADGLRTEMLHLPLAPVVYFMAVCCALSGAVLVGQAVSTLSHRKDPGGAHG